MDAIRVPLKTIQERIRHALSGSFTLDVYGGKSEWDSNLEAARLAGAEIERAVQRAIAKRQEQEQCIPGTGFRVEEEKPRILGLTTIRHSRNRNGLEAAIF